MLHQIRAPLWNALHAARKEIIMSDRPSGRSVIAAGAPGKKERPIPRPIVETDLQPGERVCHRKDPYLTGHVAEVADNRLSVMALWDGDPIPEWQPADNIVPIGREKRGGAK
jgi:hypothetical protein